MDWVATQKISKKRKEFHADDCHVEDGSDVNFREIADNITDLTILRDISAAFSKHCLDPKLDIDCNYYGENIERKDGQKQPYYSINFEGLGKVPKIEELMVFYSANLEVVNNIYVLFPIETKDTLDIHIWVNKSVKTKKVAIGVLEKPQTNKKTFRDSIISSLRMMEVQAPKDFGFHSQILGDIHHSLTSSTYLCARDIFFDIDFELSVYRLKFTRVKEISLGLLIEMNNTIKKRNDQNKTAVQFDLKSKYIGFTIKKKNAEIDFSIFF